MKIKLLFKKWPTLSEAKNNVKSQNNVYVYIENISERKKEEGIMQKYNLPFDNFQLLKISFF